MLACLFIEGLGALASWISAGKVWTQQINLSTVVYEFRKHFICIKLSEFLFPFNLAVERNHSVSPTLAVKWWGIIKWNSEILSLLEKWNTDSHVPIETNGLFILANYCSVRLLLGSLSFPSQVKNLPHEIKATWWDSTAAQTNAVVPFPFSLIFKFLLLSCASNTSIHSIGSLAWGVATQSNPSQKSVFLMGFPAELGPKLAHWKATGAPIAAQDKEWEREVGANTAAPLWWGSKSHRATPAAQTRTWPLASLQKQKHLFKEESAWLSGRQKHRLHTALDASLHSCKHSYFSTSTSDFPRYTFKEVNCTNPIPFLPKFSSPTFQLASQHCSKWRIEQRWCKWTWWIASSKETENINIFIISGIHTILTCTTTAPRFNKHTCRTPK